MKDKIVFFFGSQAKASSEVARHQQHGEWQ